MTQHLLVLSNLPDHASAQSLAQALVEARLAACVNIMAPCQSTYRWKGNVEQAQEVPILIKTTRDGYAKLEQAIVAHHPYEVPEIIALPIVAGLPAYLGWLDSETQSAK